MAEYFVRYSVGEGFDEGGFDPVGVAEVLRLVAEMEHGNLRYLFVEAEAP